MALSGYPKLQNGEIVVEEEEATTRKFKRFDIVSGASDHHYHTTYLPKNKNNNNNNASDCFKSASIKVHKRIMREWKILEKDLPESIYVRAYEQRIDLLRAVIVGSAGTPYHDGLFFFDIAFPSDYPNRPPMVHYRSFGLRLNPNLYSNGRVCLSLLNTWTGRRNEKWDPNQSTVLQVLVSIQGLVLNQKPYFNEPGVDILPGRIKKSLAYSENVYVLSCKTMLYLLKTPPKNFENFVSMHFRERASDILNACNAYMNGIVRVGYCKENGSVISSGSIDVSSKFKVAMEPLFTELVEAFTRNGASLGNFVEQVRKKNEMVAFKEVKKKNKKMTTASFLLKILQNIKKILGLRKVGKGKAKKIKLKSY
ncbi:unnamed protein product [Ilex paraguariensis]|uniref:UBC core domain-containing protein n=1 Tax=Ilex paraguariensis TaxID=185542 RepID=A0ABC8RL23_9AQUA